MSNKLELYIHIPFCVKKCAYCDFLSGPADEDVVAQYVEALVQEIRSYAGTHGLITSIFIGGGTPSLLEPIQIENIFKALRETFSVADDAEITIEANPGTVTAEKLQTYKACKINRISFGLQSVNNEELKLLGRIHTYEEFLESYRMAREAGFDNINVDLISAIPKQTLQSWENTLQQIIALKPEHISAYSLIVEDGTPFANLYGEGCLNECDLPNEDAEREIYYQTEAMLREAGYYRYEISNYAKAGKECRHNLGYWERKNYLGLGLGAASLLNNVRFSNTADLQVYIKNAKNSKAIRCGVEELNKKAQMEEFVFLGMRKTVGISVKEFKNTFHIDIEECYGKNLERMLSEGLIEKQGDYLRLTTKGIDVSNYVFAELLWEES